MYESKRDTPDDKLKPGEYNQKTEESIKSK